MATTMRCQFVRNMQRITSSLRTITAFQTPRSRFCSQCSCSMNLERKRTSSLHKPHHFTITPIQRFTTAPVETADAPDELYRLLNIEVKGHDTAVLDSYEQFAVMAANELDITVANRFSPPRWHMRRTLLKAAFVQKKHRVQYEMRTYFRVIELKYLTGSTADTYLEYIQRNLPEGMAMKVTRHRLETLPEHVRSAKKENENPT